MSPRIDRIVGHAIIALAIVVAGSLLPRAQTGSTVVTGRDPKTGATVTAVGDQAGNALRTRVVATDPSTLQPGNVKVVGPLGNALSAPLNATPVNVIVIGQRYGDPCLGLKSSVAISQAANAKLLSAYPGHRLMFCSLVVVGADAENISLVEGTGTTCGTGTTAIIGGATAAAGPNFAANGGFSTGDGVATIAVQASAANDVCLFQSGAGRVAGVLTYAFTQ